MSNEKFRANEQLARAEYWIIEYENGDLKVMRQPPRDPTLYKSVTPVAAIDRDEPKRQP